MATGVVCIKGETKKLDSREDVADIVKQIEECERLTTLQLSGNSFGVEAATAIGEALAKKPNFSKALWSDMFVSRLKSEIPQALIALGEGIMAAKSHLTELDLSDNAFGPTGVEPIIPLLTSPSFYSIKVLKFNNNGLGIAGGTFLSQSLLQCHEEAQSAGEKLALEVFVAGRNRLEDAGATALSEVFEAIGSLVEVSMPQNGITSDGICALANAFNKNPNLEVIDLNDNTFTEVGSKSMADVLPNLQKLRVINFGDCLVRPGGARAISSAIKDGHRQLEELNLCYGELDQDAGLVVVDSMANKQSLKKLELNGNYFGEECMELMRGSLAAKGLADVLGTLSDDEGLEGEDGEELSEDSGVLDESNEAEDIKEKSATEAITVEDYLSDPSGENLVALGEDRNQILLDYIADGDGGQETHGSEERVAWVVDTVAVFAKVTRDYYSCVTAQDTHIRGFIENAIDALLQPLFQEGLVSELLNEILVQIGLLKSEDKKFVPLNEIEGPVCALSHVARSEYFPRESADVLITFFTRESRVLIPLQQKQIVYKLIQVLHTL